MFYRATLLFLLTVSLLLAHTTRTQAAGMICLPPDDMATALRTTGHQAPLAHALLADGTLMTLFVAAKGGWTITLRAPGRLACIVAGGTAMTLLHRDGLTPDTAT